jgi:hypothetical protein
MRKSRKSAEKARSPVKGKTAKHAPAKGSKLEKIGKLLSRKEGCTTAEVLKATGWPAVSMPQQAKMLGVKLKTEKGPFGPEGRTVTRYWAA